MKALRSADSREILLARRDVIVRRWYRSITTTSFVALDAATLRSQLAEWWDQLVNILLAETPVRHRMEVLGAAMARLEYTQPATLAETLELLGQELTADLSATEVLRLQPRAASMLAYFAGGFLAQLRDMTLEQQEAIHTAFLKAQRQTEVALRTTEARYETVFAHAAEGVVLVDAGTGAIWDANPAFQHMVGYGEEELRAMTLFQIVADTPATIESNLRRARQSGHYALRRRPYRRSDGNQIIVDGNATLLPGECRPLLALIVRDVTDEVQREAELATIRRELDLNEASVRRELAQELHDGVLQELLGVRYILGDFAMSQQNAISAESRQQLETVIGHMGVMVRRLRAQITGLRPLELAPGELSECLQHYAEVLTAHSECAVDLHLDPAAAQLPQPVALCLYRAAREGIWNARKHSEAQRITVRLRIRSGVAVLRIADNGRGFPVPPHWSMLADTQHYGLLALFQNVDQEGGKMRLHSRPGRGTVLTVWMPVSS